MIVCRRGRGSRAPSAPTFSRAALPRLWTSALPRAPQHYGGSRPQLGPWVKDYEMLNEALALWRAQRPPTDRSRAAFVREGSALHFVGYNHKDPPKFSTAAFNSSEQKESCKCLRVQDSHSPTHMFWRVNTELRRVLDGAPHVHVINFYNETLVRDDLHKGDMCSYRYARVNGIAVATNASARRLAVKPIRMCCDCLHICYSPVFYDSTFFTPIWHALVGRHGYVPSREPVRAHPIKAM